MDPNNIIIYAIIVTSLATFISRFFGAITSEKVSVKSKAFQWFNCVAYSTLAALLGRMIVFPAGVLADSSANTPKKSRSRSPLDRIHSSLKDIMKTLKKRRKLMLNKSRRMRVQADKEKKGRIEFLLEKKKKTGNNMVKSAASAASGWWERLQTFLLMTLAVSYTHLTLPTKA